jgi:Insertion element 4 transposase N-terminal
LCHGDRALPDHGAAGVLAPGHLGELTRYLPFELAGDVLESTRTTERRRRALPSRVGIYFVLAMTMFPGIGYLRVWDKMTAALARKARNSLTWVFTRRGGRICALRSPSK